MFKTQPGTPLGAGLRSHLVVRTSEVLLDDRSPPYHAIFLTAQSALTGDSTP
jgi:hypothetical protein